MAETAAAYIFKVVASTALKAGASMAAAAFLAKSAVFAAKVGLTVGASAALNAASVAAAASDEGGNNNGKDKGLSPYAFTKSKNLELLENLKNWFNLKYEVIYFYNVYGKRQIEKGEMATVIGVFENQYKKGMPLSVVLPGTQTRRFTHITDTIKVCYLAWKKNKCAHYCITHRKSYSINDVAKMFKSKIYYLPTRLGERYASALTNMSFNNKVIKKYGKISLKDYVTSFIKDQKLI